MQFLVRGGVEVEVCGAWVEVGSESDSPSPANWPGHPAGVEEGETGFRVWLFDFSQAQLSQPHDIILSLNNALTL